MIIKTIRFDNTSCSDVLSAIFDENWKRELTNEHVVYTATSYNAEVTLYLKDDHSQDLVFDYGSKILVAGKTYHLPPHKEYR
ncbi:hypothetical protein ACJEBI_28745 [Bacillus salipaludis]|uniref:AraC family transcriptional regulator n=1 Tax=Bacillus salipaludis TaxID=2547811 RepID=A0ABW8RPG9_9BACI